MPYHKLTLSPLTQEAFEPYGNVVETTDAHHFSINNGSIERYHNLANVDLGEGDDVSVSFSIAACNIVTCLPFEITFVERHPLASQLFFPLFKDPMIVVVAPVGESVEVNSLRAFYSNGKQGINYNRGIWHMPLIALDDSHQFIVVDRSASGKNCDEFYFSEKDDVILENLPE